MLTQVIDAALYLDILARRHDHHFGRRDQGLNFFLELERVGLDKRPR